MTNFEKWLKYTDGLSSPQNYIEWSFRYLIAASLQRRVWCGPDHQKCFANQYVILVGNPGIGKGLCIREVSNCLKHWKFKDAIKLSGEVKNIDAANAVRDADIKLAQEKELQSSNGKTAIMEPLLIPVAADATTYEALVSAVASSYRRIAYPKKDSAGNDILGFYGHASLCFSLQELSSLLRKRTNDTVNYMLGLYDCPDDYEYDTKTQGKERVVRGCLNVLAGTTPGFMQSVFNDELVDEGFSSRAFFIYAEKNRKSQFWIPQLTTEQLECKKDLVEHIRKLTALYGPAKIGQDSIEFLESWWQEYQPSISAKANSSHKLLPYYSRKNIHVMKVAMALHFGESTEMFIPLDRFKEAIEVLAKEEVNMHKAIVMEGKNALAGIAKKVIELLKNGKKNFVDLHADTFDYADKKQLEDTLSFLVETNQIESDPVEDEITQQKIVYFKLKGQ